MVGCLIVTSILDVTTAHVPPSGELNHVTEVVGLVSLWLLSRTPGAQRPDHPDRPELQQA